MTPTPYKCLSPSMQALCDEIDALLIKAISDYVENAVTEQAIYGPGLLGKPRTANRT